MPYKDTRAAQAVKAKLGSKLGGGNAAVNAVKSRVGPRTNVHPNGNTGIVPPGMGSSPIPRPRAPGPLGPRNTSDGPRPRAGFNTLNSIAAKKLPPTKKRT